MTGPEGDQPHGYWEFLKVNAPESFEVLDGFATADGEPDREQPTMRMNFHFEETDTGSRLLTTTYFNSAEELEKLVAMGMMEGTKAAMGQIDAVVADLRSFSADLPVLAQKLSDTQVRISRVIRGSAEDVWRAHHEPDLLRKWELGPDGWVMTTCEVASTVGDTYTTAWEDANGEQGFGFTGELLESVAPFREVTTEKMIGTELTLTPVEGGTLLNLLITYPDAETRDQILATGMTSGMEDSYARLESEVLAAA
jgi:uncharacterized protein YndB with AHSA1/START domain